MTQPSTSDPRLPTPHCPGWIRFTSLDAMNAVVSKGGFGLSERDMGVVEVMQDMDSREYAWRKLTAHGLTLKERAKIAIRCVALSVAEWTCR